MKYSLLYNLDENDNIRIWYMERDGDKFRTISGIEDGKLVTSKWTVAKPKNVGKSNETNGEQQAELEIAALYKKKQDQKYSTNKENATRSNILQPMLAIKWADLKNVDEVVKECWSQPKLDGIRALVSKEGIKSRNGKDIVSCPHIIDQLHKFFKHHPYIVLDGELYNHQFHDDFNEIASLVKQIKPTQEDFDKSNRFVQFHVYDAIGPGLDSYKERVLTLHNMSSSFEENLSVKLVKTTYCDSIEFVDVMYASYLEHGYEGQMIRLDKPYEHKRSKGLIKRKEFFDAEYKILSITEGKGNWSGHAKSVECITEDGKPFSAGIKGNQEFTKRLLEGPLPKLCTIRSPNLTPDGIPRFGVAVEFFQHKREY